MNTHTCNKLRQLHDPVLEQQLRQAAAKTLTRTRSVCRDGGQVKKLRTEQGDQEQVEKNGMGSRRKSHLPRHRSLLLGTECHWSCIKSSVNVQFIERSFSCLAFPLHATPLLRKCRSYVFNAPSELLMVGVPVWSRFWIQKQMKAIGWVAMHHHAIAEGILAKNSNLHFSIDFDFLLGYALLHGLMTPAGCICVWSLDYRMKAAFSIAVEPCAASPHQSSHQRRFLKAYFCWSSVVHTSTQLTQESCRAG